MNHETDITIHWRSWSGIPITSRPHYPSEEIQKKIQNGIRIKCGFPQDCFSKNTVDIALSDY